MKFAGALSLGVCSIFVSQQANNDDFDDRLSVRVRREVEIVTCNNDQGLLYRQAEATLAAVFPPPCMFPVGLLVCCAQAVFARGCARLWAMRSVVHGRFGGAMQSYRARLLSALGESELLGLQGLHSPCPL